MSPPGGMPALGHEIDVPSRTTLMDELRGINQQLQFARDRVDEALAATGTAPVTVLNKAQVAFFGGDHEQAAGRLLDLVARPGFDRHPAYPEALSWLGESLWALGLHRAARSQLRAALLPPRQTPSGFRRRLSGYLARASADAPLDELRSIWRRAQRLPAPAEPTAEERALPYHYGRALFRGGALGEAEAIFAAVPDDAPDAMRARYFQGVIALKRGEIVDATARFEAAQALWLGRAGHLAVKPVEIELTEVEPGLTMTERPRPEGEETALDPDTALPDPDDPDEALRRIGAVIHLALARLAAAAGDDSTAWQYYRQVPPGDPDHAAALAEATFVLFRLERYDWCVRLVDQLVAERGDDLSAAQLRLWRSQLLARGARYDEARESYTSMEASMQRRLQALDRQLERDERLFPAAALAWTAPKDAQRARQLEAELVGQAESLSEAAEIAEALVELSGAADALPMVRDGQALSARLSARLEHFATHLTQAGQSAHPPGSPEEEQAHGGGAPATADDVARMRTSLARLRGRIARFDERLIRYQRAYRQRLQRVIAEEVPALERLQLALSAEQRAAEALGQEMRVAARQNLDTFAAEALFGQVDLAYWRKEEISRKIREATEARDAANKSLDEPLGAAPTARGREEPPEPEDEADPAGGAPDAEPAIEGPPAEETAPARARPVAAAKKTGEDGAVTGSPRREPQISSPRAAPRSR